MANDGTLNFDTKIDSSGFSSGVSKMGSVAKAGIGVTTTILKGATAAVTALGGAAVKVGSDFESAMSQVQAISGASGEELEQLKNKAKEMGASTKFSATESAEALNYMAMAGWKTEDMLGGLEGIMNLAAASGEDLATTSDIVTDALTAFGMGADESGHFADILAAASSNANTNVSMMGETFKYVAPLAGSLGYSAEDVATAVGLMANAGIKGSQAGTALRSTLTRLAKPTKESATAMEALGISITDSEGNMKPLCDVIGDMRASFAGLSEDEKASYAAMLGGQEAMSGLLAIVNASEEDFNKLSGAITNADGCALEMAEVMQDNLQGQLTILQSGLEGLGISIYETFQGAAKDVVKEAQGMVQQLQDAFNNGGLEGLVSAVGDVLAQIVQKIANAAPELINMAVSLVQSFCEGIRNADGIGESAAKLITSLVTGIASCVGEMWSTAILLVGKLAEGIAANAPQILQAITGALSSIGSAVATVLPTLFNLGLDLIGKLTEGIQQKLPELIPLAMNALMNFSGTLRESAGQLVDAGLKLIMTLAQALIDNIPVFIETIPTIITNIAGIINDNAPKLLASGVELIGKLVMGIIQAIPTIVANIPKIIEAIVSVFTAFNWLSLGKNIITFIGNGIKSLATSIPQAIKNIGQTAMDWLRAINWRTLGADIIDLIEIGIQSLVTAIPNLLKTIGQNAVNFFKSIDWLDLGVNLVKGIIAGITGALSGLWSAVKELGSGILDGIKSFFGINSPSTVMAEQGQYLVEGLVNGITELPAKLAATLAEALSKLIQWGQQMLANIKSIVQNVVNSAEQLISQLPGKIWTWLVNVVTKVTAWGQQMLTTAKTAIQTMISNVVSLISELPGKIWTHLVNVVTKVTTWGQQMLSTATTAMQNMISKVVSLISELPGKIWTHLVNVVTKVTTWGQQMLSTATTAMQNMISKVVSLISELPGKVWTHLVNVVTKVTTWGQQMLSNASSAITNMISKIISLLSELPGKVWTQLSNVISKVTQFASDLASKATQAASGFVTNLVNGVSSLPGKFTKIGSNIVSGIWNGISSGWQWLKDKVSRLASSLLDAAKRALGISSPSKKFRDQVGKWLLPGVTEGVEKTMPQALKDMKAEAGKLVEEMQGTVDASMSNFTLATANGANMKAATGGATFVEIDNSQSQENNYHVAVPSPSEVAKNQREAFRNFQKGVK